MNLQKLVVDWEDEVIGFTCSTFDLLHAGHILMLQQAKANCDILVVGLLTDPTHDREGVKNPPVQTILERWIQLESVSSVDYIIPFDSEADLLNLIKIINPDIRFVGEEYKDKKFTGYDLGKIMFTSRTHNFSSSELRDRIKLEKSVKVSEEKKIERIEELYEKQT